MPHPKKKSFPLENIRRFLEPGPVVLVSSYFRGERNIMTMGWHLMMGFSPALFGCYIWDENFSRRLILKSQECVVNLPTIDLIDAVIGIGNRHGCEPDKFEEFGLTAIESKKVAAPSIAECYANFECKLYDASLVKKYNFFLFEVVHANVAIAPKLPKTLHYRGQGMFMESGRSVSYKRRFKPENL